MKIKETQNWESVIQKYLQKREDKEIINKIYQLIHSNFFDYSSFDLKSDFFTYFLEKHLKDVLNKLNQERVYQKEGFIISAVRKQLYEFKKKQYKNYHACYPLKEENISYNQVQELESFYLKENIWIILYKELDKFTPFKRIILKLYLGLSLNIEDVKFLVQEYGIEKTKNLFKILKTYKENLLKEEEIKQQKLRNYNSESIDGMFFKKNKITRHLCKFFNIKRNVIYNSLKKLKYELEKKYRDYYKNYEYIA